MCNVLEAADAADMIINGYAFKKDGTNIKVLNLNKSDRASVIDNNGEVIETSMDDIELNIVLNYYKRNKKYMEE